MYIFLVIMCLLVAANPSEAKGRKSGSPTHNEVEDVESTGSGSRVRFGRGLNKDSKYDGQTLSRSELMTCVYAQERIDDAFKKLAEQEHQMTVAETKMDSRNQDSVERFNDLVREYNEKGQRENAEVEKFNSTCANRAYYESDMQAVRKEISDLRKPRSAQAVPVVASVGATVKPTVPTGSLGIPYQDVFEKAAKKHRAPINVLLALANLTPSIPNKGRANTVGIMQYAPSTAKALGIDPTDPLQSIDAAAMQYAERIANGYTPEDAIKAHISGDDRAAWNDQTRRYSKEAMGRVKKFGQLYKSRPPKAAPVTEEKVELDNVQRESNVAHEPVTVIETWACKEDGAFGPLITAKVFSDQTGSITAGGVTYNTSFRMLGFDRRWDFGEDSEYAFVINVDKVGAYFDFGNNKSAMPSKVIECR